MYPPNTNERWVDMRPRKKTLCKVIKESDADVFQDKYTALINSVHGSVDANVQYSDGYFVAVITYETVVWPDDERTVADEFHDEGLRYVCSQCPYLEVSGDRRRKRFPCKYSEYGTARIDSECCEMFYKKVKQGTIEPMEGDRYE